MIEEKYIDLIKDDLLNFKKVKSGYRFSCPFCGDSMTNNKKTRGNIYKTHDKLLFRCFNCESRSSFDNLLKFINPDLYNQFLIEKYIESYNPLYVTKIKGILKC